MSKPMSHAKRPVTQANLDAFRERMEEYKRIIDGDQKSLSGCTICKTVDDDCRKCIFGITTITVEARQPVVIAGCRTHAGSRDRTEIRAFDGKERAIAAAQRRLKVLEAIPEDYLSRWTFGW